MPSRIKPRALRPGDTIGICSPAGLIDPPRLVRLIAQLHAWGFAVRVAPHTYSRYGYLAGTDAERLSDLNALLADATLAAIVFSRGGYGTMRLLSGIDYETLARAPKAIVGFSDITALHLALARHCGLVTFHGPMSSPESNEEATGFNAQHLHRALTSTEPLGLVPPPPGGPPLDTLVPGRASGTLVGGNLTLIAATLGTPYEIDTRGAILLLEDVGEEPYRIDRMLTQLILAGKIADAAAIVIGEMVRCAATAGGAPNEEDPQAPSAERGSLTLSEVFWELLAPFGKPVLSGLCFGHGKYCATIPLGVQATLDAGAQTLIIDEPACVG